MILPLPEVTITEPNGEGYEVLRVQWVYLKNKEPGPTVTVTKIFPPTMNDRIGAILK